MSDKEWSATKVMAWATWALSGVFALSALLVQTPMGYTTTVGMVLCTVSIVLAAAATTQHVRALLCSFDSRVTEAHQLGRLRGRVEAEDAGLRRVQ